MVGLKLSYLKSSITLTFFTGCFGVVVVDRLGALVMKWYVMGFLVVTLLANGAGWFTIATRVECLYVSVVVTSCLRGF